jgi:hypothetical protein
MARRRSAPFPSHLVETEDHAAFGRSGWFWPTQWQRPGIFWACKTEVQAQVCNALDIGVAKPPVYWNPGANHHPERIDFWSRD